jgi:hypothetical protein
MSNPFCPDALSVPAPSASAEDWTAFCHDNGLQHEPQVIGGNAST